MRLAGAFLLLLCSLLAAPALRAHGSVTAEGDLCLIRIGFYSAHFKVFQPQRSGNREYCEDLPAAGESVFVMDYVHQGLAEVPIEFRIIRNVTDLGRFAQLDDVRALGDLDAVTVFHQPPVIEPGVFTVLHEFTGDGEFLGIVSVRHPDSGELYEAVFPFSVGFQGWGLLPLFLALAAAAQILHWLSTGGIMRWRLLHSATRSPYARVMMLLPLMLLMAATAPPQYWESDSGALRASYTSEVMPLPLNRMHGWTLHLETRDGTPLENAEVTIDGGMPAHNHGLATAPAVTAHLGNGDYRVEGLRFHMQGEWELRLTVRHAGKADRIVIPLSL
ncbi:MAG: FixH family protein [Gammaproteobacteria bacterium]